MHTDEYTISLSREVAVCDSAIRKVRRALFKLEQRYGYSTAHFVEQVRTGLAGSLCDDFRHWLDLAMSLRAWTDKKEEYASLLLKMKR